MSTLPVTSSTAGTSAIGATPQTTNTAAGGALGQTQFLQLLMTQMKNQDPLNPSDPTQYMSELAQFTSVEQQTRTAQASETLATEQAASTAISLIGHTVNYTDPTSGNAASGTVQSVQISSSGPTLTVNGTPGVELSTIGQVS